MALTFRFPGNEAADRMVFGGQGAGRRFGDERAPLLVSVRSGAPVSMPGMMDTVLNVGLTPAGARALAEETGDQRFALSSLGRLLHAFATFGEVLFGARGEGHRGIVARGELELRPGEEDPHVHAYLEWQHAHTR
jgi:hypothetical protein